MAKLIWTDIQYRVVGENNYTPFGQDGVVCFQEDENIMAKGLTSNVEYELRIKVGISETEAGWIELPQRMSNEREELIVGNHRKSGH